MSIKSLWLAVLSSLLQISIFPNFNLDLLAWVFLVPLFFSLEGKTSFQCFIICLIFGSLSAAGTTYWLYPTVTGYFEQPLLKGIVFATGIQIFFAGFYFALFGLIYSILSSTTNLSLRILLVSSSWVVCEYFRSTLLTGLPWELVAHSQYRNLFLIQISDITGVYGLSFVIVSINFAIYLIVKSCLQKNIPARIQIKKYKFVLLPALLLLLVIFYGKMRVAEYTITSDNSTKTDTDEKAYIRISVIQGNIKSNYRWRSAYYGRNLRKYLNLSKKALRHGAQIIIWPENAINFYLEKEHFHLTRIRQMLKKANACLIVGGPRYEKAGANQHIFFNSAYFITPEQGIAGLYDKIHLLPFSEYDFVKSINLYGEERKVDSQKYISGRQYSVFSFLNTQFSVLICYEIIYPHLVRHFVKKGASFLINISNDSWFGKGAGPFQHLSLSIFRAVENKVFLMRASTTGISAIIAPTGKIRKASRLFQEAILTDRILPRMETTFYTEYGDLFAGACILLTICAITAILLKRTILKKNR